MDFNPLDLLASTALGDSNSVHKSAQTDQQQPKPTGAQEEDPEEEEPDESVEDKTQNVDDMTCEGVDSSCQKSHKMGSVKSLKKKKAFSKCTTATNVDSGCGGKKSVEDMHSITPASASMPSAKTLLKDQSQEGHVVDWESQKNIEQRKEGTARAEDKTASPDSHIEISDACGSCREKAEPGQAVQTSGEAKVDYKVTTESEFCKSDENIVKPDSCNSCEITKHTKDSKQGLSPCAKTSIEESWLLGKAAVKVDCVRLESEIPPGGENTQGCSNNVAPVHDLNQCPVDSEKVKTELVNGTSSYSSSLNLWPQLDMLATNKVQETHTGEKHQTDLCKLVKSEVQETHIGEKHETDLGMLVKSELQETHIVEKYETDLSVLLKNSVQETHAGEIHETNLELISGTKGLQLLDRCPDAGASMFPASSQKGQSVGLVFLDHCYAVHPGRPLSQQSSDAADDNADVFECGDESGSVEDIERRPRSLSVDSNYLQYGLPGTPMSNEHEQDHLPQTDKLSLLSPTPSVDSLSNDSAMSENSNVQGHFYSILVHGSLNQTRISHQPVRKFSMAEGLPSSDEQYSGIESVKFYNPSPMENNSCTSVTPKCGKFRIGTFASFSSSNLELDRDSSMSKTKDRLKIGIPSESGVRSSLPSPALASPGSPFQLLQSPGIEWDRSDAGSDMQDDPDSSATEDRYLSSSHGSDSFGTSARFLWAHSVYHDHDYCSKEVSDTIASGKPVAEVRPLKVGKRKYTRRKDKLELLEIDEDSKNKLKNKGKYLKQELLKQDSRFSLPSTFDMKQQGRPQPLLDQVGVKPNPVGRPRKRVDKQVESDIDPETGAKMKITGNFKDHYVYYYSKSNHNTRRKLREGVSLPSSDKIILPAPKPGDIVVPHLSDADIEAIKRGGRAALKKNGLGVTSGTMPPVPHQDQMADMDSKIVNTILSMENDTLGSPLPAQGDDLSDHIDLYEEQPASDSVGFMGESMALTPDQVDLLLSVVKDVEVPSYPLEHGDHRLTTSQAYEYLTSGDTSHSASTVLDSLAATTVEKDFMESIMPHSDSKNGVGNLDNGVASSASIKIEPFERSSLDERGLKVSLKEEPKCDQDSDKGILDTSLPPTSLPMATFDKTLEFLKEDFRTDLFPEAAIPPVPVDGTTISSARISEQTPVDTTETPWIVTVTIYWNDIPAIIINNQPYVRLVDIHKQILPAKDTGILKKRCQLMNIPVQNCTDMQRYFLVQYGRAYNSKSTLVITKDQAQELIGYYVDPQPRLRTEEGSSYLRKSASCAEFSSLSDSPAHHPSPFASPRRRGGFRHRTTPGTSRNLSPVSSPKPAPSPELVQPARPPTPIPASVPAEIPVSSKRLRHKKINFLELLRGEESALAPSPESPRPEDVSLDADVMDDSVVKEDYRGAKRKRGRSKDTQDGGHLVKQNGRGFRKKRKNDDSKMSSPRQVEKMEVVDVDVSVERNNSDESVKVKKRSPGLSAASSSAASNRPRTSRCGPLKVKLKSLLQFPRHRKSRKGLVGKTLEAADEESVGRSMPLRVLKITHQDAEGGVTGRGVMSQEAEVHLDLYKQRTSLCVKCWTCEKFLSVPRFLQHQHLSASSQSLTAVKQLQVLMPRNKENISQEEECLWNEFVRLKKHLDQSSVRTGSVTAKLYGEHHLRLPESALPSDVSPPFGIHSSASEHRVQGFSHLDDVDQSDSGLAPDSVGSCIEQGSTPTSVSSPDDGIGTNSDASIADEYSGGPDTRTVGHKNSEILFQNSSFPSPPVTHTVKEKKLETNLGDVNTPTTIHCQGQPTVPLKVKQRVRKVFPSSHVRTSSRKRKEKQFFSIENYSFSRKIAKIDGSERRERSVSIDGNLCAEKHASGIAHGDGSELMSFT